MTSPAKSIGELVEPLIASSGLELWDVEQAPGTVRVYVDQPGGVGLDTLGSLAKSISAVLDAHDDVVPGGPYQLEVSSPGVERTLRTPRHYQRFIGSLVSVKTVTPVAGGRRFEGVLEAADEAGFRIGAPGDPSMELRYDQVQKARTVWAAAKPGPSPRTGSAKPLASRKGSAL